MIKVLSVELKDPDCLPKEEIIRIKSVVGTVLSVYSVTDEHVSVKKVWEDGGVLSKGVSLSLRPHQRELVE